MLAKLVTYNSQNYGGTLGSSLNLSKWYVTAATTLIINPNTKR